MKSKFKLSLVFTFVIFFTGALYCQFQDSIVVAGDLATSVVHYDNPSGSYIFFGTTDMVLNKYKLTSEGLEKADEEKFGSLSDLQNALPIPTSAGKITYGHKHFYEQKYTGSGLGGYFAPYKFESSRMIMNSQEEKAAWDLPLEKTNVDSYEKHLTTAFNFDNSTYSVLVSGHKIKKDKSKKNNEHKDFEVFIYNGEKLKKFETQIKTEWGVIPNSAGVYTDTKGNHLGFYIEFDLGGGADGLAKMNKEATKNSKFVALLDEKAKFVRMVQAEMPIRMGTLNVQEFFVNNVILVGDKVNLYVVTREYKFGNGGTWIPGYFTFKEEESGKMKYLGNLSYVDYQSNLTTVFNHTNRIDDMSTKTTLKNGNLSSLGTSDGKTFKYMNTKADGNVEVFGTFVFPHSKLENPVYRIDQSEANGKWTCILVNNKFSSSKLESDFIFVDKENGNIVPIIPAQDVVTVQKRITKYGIISYGLGKANPKAIHIAYSPNYLEN